MQYWKLWDLFHDRLAYTRAIRDRGPFVRLETMVRVTRYGIYNDREWNG